MESMPKPLFKRLMLTSLVGTGCLIVGIIFYLMERDASFLFLSVAIFLFSIGKAVSTYTMAKTNSYVIVEGICISIHPIPLCKCNEIILEDLEGNNLKLMLGRNYRLRHGLAYRIYFKTASGISPGKNPFMQKALLTDNLLGIEPIEPSSTISDTIPQS